MGTPQGSWAAQPWGAKPTRLAVTLWTLADTARLAAGAGSPDWLQALLLVPGPTGVRRSRARPEVNRRGTGPARTASARRLRPARRPCRPVREPIRSPRLQRPGRPARATGRA